MGAVCPTEGIRMSSNKDYILGDKWVLYRNHNNWYMLGHSCSTANPLRVVIKEEEHL